MGLSYLDIVSTWPARALKRSCGNTSHVHMPLGRILKINGAQALDLVLSTWRLPPCAKLRLFSCL